MFKSLRKKSTQREEGQGLVEYALILVLVSVVVVVVLSLVGPGVGNIFSQVVSTLNGDVAVASSDALPEACLGDLVAPIEYYKFAEGQEFIPAPASFYREIPDCSGSPNGTDNITVVRGTFSQDEANAICQAQHGRDANKSSEVYWCPA